MEAWRWWQQLCQLQILQAADLHLGAGHRSIWDPCFTRDHVLRIESYPVAVKGWQAQRRSWRIAEERWRDVTMGGAGRGPGAGWSAQVSL